MPEGIVALDELEILVVVDNETDTLSSVDEGVPQIPEVVHLAAGLPANRKYHEHECKTVFDQLCCACQTRYREWCDTVLLGPRQRREVAFVADNPGDCMFHYAVRCGPCSICLPRAKA